WANARTLPGERSSCGSATPRPTSLAAPLLRRDPVLDLLVEDGERQGSRHQHLGVELARIEARAERLLRPGADFGDLHLADLIGERLARHRDVALGLGGGVGAAARAVVEDVLDRPVAGPPLRMDAGVDDQPDRPEQLR